MRYQYNFGFLQEWKDANKNIQKGQIIQALSIRSNNGLNTWMNGDGPMPVMTMLRFCNSFNIPISCFFRDMDAKEGMTGAPSLPQINDMLEPAGGFGSDVRSRGDHSILNPLPIINMPSVCPGVGESQRGDETTRLQVNESTSPLGSERRLPEQERDYETTSPLGDESTRLQVNKSTRLRGDETCGDIQSLIKLQEKHQMQIGRLLDIIADQQKHIADLTTKLMEVRGERKTYYDNIDVPTMQVAENCEKK